MRNVLPTVQGHVICKNCHLCELCWEDCERKYFHINNYPDVAAAMTRLLRIAWGE